MTVKNNALVKFVAQQLTVDHAKTVSCLSTNRERSRDDQADSSPPYRSCDWIGDILVSHRSLILLCIPC